MTKVCKIKSTGELGIVLYESTPCSTIRIDQRKGIAYTDDYSSCTTVMLENKKYKAVFTDDIEILADIEEDDVH